MAIAATAGGAGREVVAGGGIGTGAGVVLGMLVG